MTFNSPTPHTVCGATTPLPDALFEAARLLDPVEEVDSPDVERELTCGLQVHSGGQHHGLVRELPGTGAGSVWATWDDAGEPGELSIRSDCPARVTEEVCCLYQGHPADHTFDLAQPQLPSAL
jgi:hypothetical protein